MCTWILPPVEGLSETALAPVIWIDDIGAVSLCDGVVTTYYYTIRAPLYGGQAEKNMELIVKRTPRAFANHMIIAANAAQMLLAPAVVPSLPPRGWTPRVVR